MSDLPDFDAETPKVKHDVGRFYEWDDKPLQPFSAGRHTALQRLRVVGGSEMETAAAFVRLCQMEARDVALLRGERAEQFLVELAEWMDKQEVGLGAKRREKTEKLMTLYRDVLNELYDAQTIAPEAEKGTKPGNG